MGTHHKKKYWKKCTNYIGKRFNSAITLSEVKASKVLLTGVSVPWGLENASHPDIQRKKVPANLSHTPAPYKNMCTSHLKDAQATY